MIDPTLFVVIVVILAWVYNFYNGMNDAANAIATTVSTRALTPKQAIVLARTLNVAGAFATTAVAKTIGKGIVTPDSINQLVIISALVGASVWSAFCTHYGIPISITHGLIGGLIGAAIYAKGVGVIRMAGVSKVFWAMIISPLAGFVAGFVLMVIIYWIFRKTTPAKVNKGFKMGQVVSTIFMSFSHGSNDTQNAMGIITAALVVGGFIDSFHVPIWVILGSAFFMGLGTSVGGWRVIKTLGMRMVKVRPVHGFTAEWSAAAVIMGATLLGAPISTTHVVSTSIMGVGATRRFSAVRWGIAGNIVATWIFTFPGAAFISVATYFILDIFI